MIKIFVLILVLTSIVFSRDVEMQTECIVIFAKDKSITMKEFKFNQLGKDLIFDGEAYHMDMIRSGEGYNYFDNIDNKNESVAVYTDEGQKMFSVDLNKEMILEASCAEAKTIDKNPFEVKKTLIERKLRLEPIFSSVVQQIQGTHSCKIISVDNEVAKVFYKATRNPFTNTGIKKVVIKGNHLRIGNSKDKYIFNTELSHRHTIFTDNNKDDPNHVKVVFFENGDIGFKIFTDNTGGMYTLKCYY